MKDVILILLPPLALFVLLFFISRNKKHKTQLIFTAIINNFQIKIISMQLDKQKFVDTVLALVNHETQEPVSATFANIVLSSSDPNIFTSDTDPNNDGIIDVVGVNEGTAILTVTADAGYTDPNTKEAKTVSKTATIDVTVSAPPPGAIETDMIVTFSEPQQV